MKNIYIFLAIVLVIFTQPVIAEGRWHSSTIKSLYPLADGKFVIILNNDSQYCTNNNVPNYHYVAPGQNGVTDEGVKNLLSVALSAAALGNSIKIYFDDSTQSCFINRFKVDY